jgi:uncharacterized protein
VVILLVFGTGDGGSTPLGTILRFKGYFMENILVVGANTRPIACSLNKIGYNVFSADYFGCKDIKPCVTDYKSFLSQNAYESSGYFSQKFKSEDLYKIADNFLDIADYVICCSGANPMKFPKKKVIGNWDVKSVVNKFKLYKTLKKKFDGIFKLPDTYLVKDLNNAHEIAQNNINKKFLLKPLEGSGGVGIIKLEDADNTAQFHEAILQEIVDGTDVSASVISNGDDASTILTSQQLIGKNSLGQINRYGYCGNIAPYIEMNEYSNNNGFKEISKEIIQELKLIGSNGVDMKVKDDNVYIMEINPRFQGTFEVAEASLGINMAEAHIKAFYGDSIDFPSPKEFAVKMIVYAKKRSNVGDLKMSGVHDIPSKNVIIEKGEPVATVLKSGKVLENTISSAKNTVKSVYNNLTIY